jgi:hypothetical protein
MIFNIGDKKAKLPLSLAKTPLLLRNSFEKLDYSKYPVCLSCDWGRRR